LFAKIKIQLISKVQLPMGRGKIAFDRQLDYAEPKHH